MKNSIFLVLITLMVPSNIFGADDPGIPRETKDKIQIAMQAHINGLIAKNGGSYPIFDPDTRNVVQLKFLAIWVAISVPAYFAMIYMIRRLNKRDLEEEQRIRTEKKNNRKGGGPPIMDRGRF